MRENIPICNRTESNKRKQSIKNCREKSILRQLILKAHMIQSIGNQYFDAKKITQTLNRKLKQTLQKTEAMKECN